jgi:hypothetical protein
MTYIYVMRTRCVFWQYTVFFPHAQMSDALTCSLRLVVPVLQFQTINVQQRQHKLLSWTKHYQHLMRGRYMWRHDFQFALKVRFYSRP